MASRLEGQSKSYGVTIILGEETERDLDEEFFCVELDKIAVKGKKDAIRIFTVLGNTSWVLNNTNWFIYQQQHTKFLDLYRGQTWGAAQLFANELKDSWPEMAGYYDVMIDRINEYKKNSPGDDWDGVYRAETK